MGLVCVCVCVCVFIYMQPPSIVMLSIIYLKIKL